MIGNIIWIVLFSVVLAWHAVVLYTGFSWMSLIFICISAAIIYIEQKDLKKKLSDTNPG